MYHNVFSPLFKKWASATTVVRIREDEAIRVCQFAGLSSSRLSVPQAERSPLAWFLKPNKRTAPGTAGHVLPFSRPPYPCLQDIWSESQERYQQAVAGSQLLRETLRESLHADINQREAAQMCHISEHMLFLLRNEQIAMHRACSDLKAIAQLCTVLESLTASDEYCVSDERRRYEMFISIQLMSVSIVLRSPCYVRFRRPISFASS
jgi:hypothetical protein